MNESVNTTQGTIVFERSYDADVEELWDLWTTKEGFESWWGPEGFRVEVHQIEPRVGGELRYDMIADAPEQIAAMKASGNPTSHATHGTFEEVVSLECLQICHVIDFIPGVAAYENRMRVEFSRKEQRACMVIRVDAHRDPHWTKMASLGMESQLTKVSRALARRRQA